MTTTLVIEHAAATGTLLSGTSRGDSAGDTLRALGWRWGRSVGAWFVPRSREAAPPRDLIEKTRASLAAAGFTVQVRIDANAPDQAGRWERLATHEAARADALTRRAERHEQRAAEHASARAALAALIPFGQPLLVDSAGHASQLRLRRTIDRHEHEETKHRQAAQQLHAAACRARTADAHRRDPIAVTNRIARLTPELRRTRTQIRATAPSADETTRARLIDREQALAGELAYWQAIHTEQLAASVTVDYGPGQVRPGDQVQIGGRWWTVLRANKSSVTVLMDPATSRTNRTPWRNVRAVRAAAPEAHGPGGALVQSRHVDDVQQQGYGDAMPSSATRMCQCEHRDHEPGGTGHRYLGVPAGTRRADYVGPICDECADGHLAEYLLPRSIDDAG